MAEEKAATEEKEVTTPVEDSVEEATADVEVPEQFKDLVETIEKLTILELADLVKVLEKKFGVSAAAPMAAAPTAGGGDETGGDEEKSSFDVEITEAGSSKISVIKVVREITELGLKEAKDLVDGAPQVVKTEASKELAEEMKGKLEEAGAKVTLK